MIDICSKAAKQRYLPEIDHDLRDARAARLSGLTQRTPAPKLWSGWDEEPRRRQRPAEGRGSYSVYSVDRWVAYTV